MTIVHSLVLILLLLCGQILGFEIAAPRIASNPEGPLAVSVANALLNAGMGLFLGLTLVYYGSVVQPRRTWRELGWHGERLGAQILTGVIGGVAISAFLILMMRGFGHPFSEPMGRILHYSLADRAFFLLIGLVASFVEESLWRGNLLPALERRLGGAAGLLLLSVLFALYHLNFRPGSLIFKTAAGIVYGALYLRNRGLVSPALAHVLSWTLVGNL